MPPPVDNVAIVIPMRAGSVEISRKNVRRVTSHDTLASLAIDRARRAALTVHGLGIECDVWVMTDDPTVEGLARAHDVRVFVRDPEKADATATIQDAVAEFVAEHDTYTVIAVMQATSPWLEHSDAVEAINHVLWRDAESATTVTPAAGFHWKESGEPLFDKRTNRQWTADVLWHETGAIHVVRDFPRFDGFDPDAWMISDTHALVQTYGQSAIDVDTRDDLVLARKVWEERRILYVCLGDTARWGGGHVHRARLICEELALSHQVHVCTPDTGRLPDKLQRWAGPETPTPAEYDCVIVDMLDEGAAWIGEAALVGTPCIALETTSAPPEVITINELLATGTGHLCGPGMATIAPEFFGFPRRRHDGPVERILVALGAADVNGWQRDLIFRLSERYPDTVVTGVMDRDMIAYELWRADIAVIGHGRMTLEAAYLGTPFVSVDQNERETSHVVLNGPKYLTGMDADVIALTIDEMTDPQVRKKMSSLLRSQVDGLGVQRIVQVAESVVTAR